MEWALGRLLKLYKKQLTLQYESFCGYFSESIIWSLYMKIAYKMLLIFLCINSSNGLCSMPKYEKMPVKDCSNEPIQLPADYKPTTSDNLKAAGVVAGLSGLTYYLGNNVSKMAGASSGSLALGSLLWTIAKNRGGKEGMIPALCGLCFGSLSVILGFIAVGQYIGK